MLNPDFVMLAQSMGVRAIQCETSEELPRKMKEFLEYDNHRPIVMVCQVDEEEELYPIVRPLFLFHNSYYSFSYTSRSRLVKPFMSSRCTHLCHSFNLR